MANPPASDRDILDGKMYAVLSYLSILCIIPLVLKKDNPFVLAHGKQGLVIFVAEAGVFIIHIVLGTFILKLGLFILGLLSFWGMIETLKGHYVKLPVVSEIAEKIIL